MDFVGFLSSLGINASPVIAIIIFVQILKMLFRKQFEKLIPNHKTLGLIYLSVVAILSIGVSLISTLQISPFNVWTFTLNAFMYLVFSVGGYELFGFLFPVLKAMIDKIGMDDIDPTDEPPEAGV